MRTRLVLMLAAVAVQISSAAVSAEPLQGGIKTNQVMEGAGDYSYPAPTMVQPQVMRPQAPVKAPPSRPLNATIQQSQPVQRPPIQATVQKQVVLPQGFMGSWRVQGQRSKVEAMPEFQAGAEQAFSLNTNNTWNIGGQPGSYSMSNGEMSTPLWVDKVEGGTAFIRYQHPVGKTMAQEAIVLSLLPGGTQFNGLERISIVKEGMAQPRAKVTYQLSGARMR
ncbi:MAG: hypothetical protein EKK48_05680 [Candidatus Melainabacteria bacterium]|nr:MAG: hypothetical protein EKK48_05680 [Candidatus Melainabacteria bacterium]